MITARQALDAGHQVEARCNRCRRVAELNLQVIIDRGRGDDPIASTFICLGWSIEPGAGSQELCRSTTCTITVRARWTPPT